MNANNPPPAAPAANGHDKAASPASGADVLLTTAGADAPHAADAGRASLIEYPSDFPIKVMGAQAEGFEPAVVAIVRQHDPTFDPATIERRPSAGGKYVGLTVTVRVTSRDQLDAIYRALTSSPFVKVVL